MKFLLLLLVVLLSLIPSSSRCVGWRCLNYRAGPVPCFGPGCGLRTRFDKGSIINPAVRYRYR